MGRPVATTHPRLLTNTLAPSMPQEAVVIRAVAIHVVAIQPAVIIQPIPKAMSVDLGQRRQVTSTDNR